MATAKPKVQGPKFPRVIVSGERHVKLAAEAKKKGVSIAQLAEAKFKRTEPR